MVPIVSVSAASVCPLISKVADAVRTSVPAIPVTVNE
jgi:hypothetical protein